MNDKISEKTIPQGTVGTDPSRGSLGNENPKIELKEINILIKKAKKDFLDEAKKIVLKEVQTDKASLITVFGIFASVISFLTIEFQFLKTVCSLDKIAGFSILLFSLLLGFNLGIDYLVKNRTSKKSDSPSSHYLLFVIVLFFIGTLLISFGNEKACEENKIYQRYEEQFEQKYKEKELEMDNRFKEYDIRLKSLEVSKKKQTLILKR